MDWTYVGEGHVPGVSYTDNAKPASPSGTITGSVYIRRIAMARKQPYTAEMVAASEGVASATQQLLNTIEPNAYYEVRVRTTPSGTSATVAVYNTDELEYIHKVSVSL